MKPSGSKDQHEMSRLLIEYGLSQPGMPEPVPELYCNINSSLAPVFDLIVDLNYSSYVGAILQSDIVDLALKYNKEYLSTQILFFVKFFLSLEFI